MRKKKLFELILEVMRKCQITEHMIRSEYGLSLAQYHALISIQPGEHLTCHNFSKKMKLSPSRGSRVINRLRKDRFLTISNVVQDRRQREVYLTRKGVDIRRKIFNKMTACEERITREIRPGQLQKIRKALEILVSVM